ncbi:putative F-box protein At5g50220 [Nicotiana sylvestris]|uniref:putative F-box protein At5g50220 n=1 Tax=Nicotiana sylvestris TaxID=4096 RepID=UPI00388CB011
MELFVDEHATRMWDQVAEIDDIEFALEMQSLKENRIPPRYIYKNFMPVCKAWKAMFSGSPFVEQNFMESKSHLLIQAASERHMKTKLIEIGKELEFESCDLGINRLGKVRPGCDGFLLINPPKDNGQLQVINPATKFSLTIPKCPSGCPHKACSAALGFDSSTKQYKVVHVYADSYGFEVLNLGSADNEWERVSGPWEDLNDRPFNPLNFSWKDPVSINGRILHWYVDSNEYIVSMQVKEGKCSITHLPKLGNVIKRNNYSLAELGGYLSFIHSASEIEMDVWILEDFRGQVWSKKHSIVVELTNYICPNKTARQNERTMPNLGKLVAIAGARNGEVLIFKHKNSSALYIYDTKIRVMKKIGINMKNIESFVLHKDSLFTMRRIS